MMTCPCSCRRATTTAGRHNFECLTTKLEVQLGEDDDMAMFMQKGHYNCWTAEKTSPRRIQALDATDLALATEEATANAKTAKRAEILNKRKRQLKPASQVAKVISEHHYNTVMKQATSLHWVYNKIKKD